MPVDRSCKSAGRTFSLPAGKGSGRIGPEVLPPKMVQRSEEIHPGKTEGRDIFGRWKRPEKSMGFLYGNQSAKKQRRKMGRGAFKRRAGKEGHFRLNVCCHLKTGAVLPVTAAATFLSGASPAPRMGAGHLWPGLCDGGTVRNPFVGVQEDHVAFLRDPSQHEDFRFKTGDPPGREIDDSDDLAPDQPFRGVPAGDLRR